MHKAKELCKNTVLFLCDCKICAAKDKKHDTIMLVQIKNGGDYCVQNNEGYKNRR